MLERTSKGTLSVLRLISTSKEFSSIGGRLSIRAASVFASGTVAAELVRTHGGRLAVPTAAELRLLAEAALLAGTCGNLDAIIAAAELVCLATTAFEFGAGSWSVPGRFRKKELRILY